MRIIALSLWERVAEGRVRAPQQPAHSFPAVPDGLLALDTLTPTPLPEGEGVRGIRIIPLSLWERVAEGRGEGTPITRRVPSLPFPMGCLHWIPSPNPLPKGEGEEGCES